MVLETMTVIKILQKTLKCHLCVKITLLQEFCETVLLLGSTTTILLTGVTPNKFPDSICKKRVIFLFRQKINIHLLHIVVCLYPLGLN